VWALRSASTTRTAFLITGEGIGGVCGVWGLSGENYYPQKGRRKLKGYYQLISYVSALALCRMSTFHNLQCRCRTAQGANKSLCHLPSLGAEIPGAQSYLLRLCLPLPRLHEPLACPPHRGNVLQPFPTYFPHCILESIFNVLLTKTEPAHEKTHGVSATSHWGGYSF
jgi:hypothetical protein